MDTCTGGADDADESSEWSGLGSGEDSSSDDVDADPDYAEDPEPPCPRPLPKKQKPSPVSQAPAAAAVRAPRPFQNRKWHKWWYKKKTVDYYDSLLGKTRAKLDATSRKCKVNFFAVQGWITKKSRAQIKEKCEEGDVTRKGGRGKKGAGNFYRTLVENLGDDARSTTRRRRRPSCGASDRGLTARGC